MTKQTEERVQEMSLRRPPQTVQLASGNRTQLKEAEREALRNRKIQTMDCRHLNGCEIAEVLLEDF